MSKLNEHILFLLFEELQNDSKSLFSCLMVNRLWCETTIPILWKNPWRYDSINHKKSSLYYVITHYLTDDIKGFLTKEGIQLPQISCKSLIFDYLSFCKSINVGIINRIISFGSSSGYGQFLLRQEFYNVLIRKCTELKYLDVRSIEHQIFYFPEAKVRLNSLCELKCDTSINPSYFYGLACICQNILRLIIINIGLTYNNGIVKLIEVQKDLRYFEWKDDFDEHADILYDLYDFCEESFLTLAKKVDTLNYLIINFHQYLDDYEHIFLEKVLPELHKLKTLKIDYHYLYNEEKLKTLVYHDLEVFSIDNVTMDTVVCIVENSGGYLKEILYPYYNEEFDDSLILIRKIYEKCPLVEYLSLAFPPLKEHFTEFKKLLKACQNLKSLLLVIPSAGTHEILYKSGEKLLEMLIESAPMNLREIRFFNDFKLSLEALEIFLEKWKGRPALSILTSDPVYNGVDYMNLINKYKTNGVIKDFRCDSRRNVYNM